MPKLKASLVEKIPGRRTQLERAAARKGIRLRDGVLAPITRRLYAEACKVSCFTDKTREDSWMLICDRS